MKNFRFIDLIVYLYGSLTSGDKKQGNISGWGKNGAFNAGNVVFTSRRF